MIKYELFVNQNKEVEFLISNANWKVYWINLLNKEKTINLKKVFEYQSGSIYIFFKFNEEKLLPFYVGQSSSFEYRWQHQKKDKGKEADFILLILSEKLNNTNIRMYYENKFIKALEEYPIDIKYENKQKNKLRNLSYEQIESEKESLNSLKILINLIIPFNFFIKEKKEDGIKIFKKEKIENQNKNNEEVINKNLNNSLNIFKNKFFYINKKIKENYINAKAIYDFNNKKIIIFKDSWISKNFYSDYLYQELLNNTKNSKKTSKTLEHQLKNIYKSKEKFKLLSKEEIILLKNDKYIFDKNYSFSPTKATNFLFGYQYSYIWDYRKIWKDNKEIDLYSFLLKFDNNKNIFEVNKKINNNENYNQNSENNEDFLKEIFYLKKENEYFIWSKITKNTNKVKILKDSWFIKIEINQFFPNYKKIIIKKNHKLINKLEIEKIIIFKNNKYIFIKEYYFNSLSGSAVFFKNININGKYVWKTENNKTFKELYDKK